MRPSLSTRQSLGLAFLVLVALYALFQGRFIILGPQIRISTPLDGSTATTSLVTVSGVAKNVTFISLDDRPIFLDEHGNFEEELLVHPGPSTIIMKARDRFGRETEKIIRIILID